MGEFETVLTKTNQKKVARNTIILLALIFKHFLRMTHGIKKKKTILAIYGILAFSFLGNTEYAHTRRPPLISSSPPPFAQGPKRKPQYTSVVAHRKILTLGHLPVYLGVPNTPPPQG